MTGLNPSLGHSVPGTAQYAANVTFEHLHADTMYKEETDQCDESMDTRFCAGRSKVQCHLRQNMILLCLHGIRWLFKVQESGKRKYAE
jgi:hypothetical protein